MYVTNMISSRSDVFSTVNAELLESFFLSFTSCDEFSSSLLLLGVPRSCVRGGVFVAVADDSVESECGGSELLCVTFKSS